MRPHRSAVRRHLRPSAVASLLAVLATAGFAAPAAPAPSAVAAVAVPPVAEVRPHVVRDVGGERVDPYHWMRDREDPAVLAYLEAENAYFDARMAPLAPLVGEIEQEILGRIREDDEGSPTRRGDYLYWWRTRRGLDYAIHLRRSVAGGPEEVILDENRLAEGKAYLTVHGLEPSPSGRKLLYLVDDVGNEEFSLHVVDLATGAAVIEPIRGVSWSADWIDEDTIAWTTFDEARRSDRAWRRRLDAPVDAAEQLWHEPDGLYRLGLGRSRSGAFLFVAAGSSTTTEYRALPTDRPGADLVVAWPRREGVLATVDHAYPGEFLVRTNEGGATDFKVVAFSDADPATGRRLVVPHRPGTKIEDVTGFADRTIVIAERTLGLVGFRVLDPAREEERTIRLPGEVYAASSGANLDPRNGSYRLTYGDLATPTTVFDADLRTGELVVVKRQEVPSGHDPADYVVHRVWATSADGTPVPVSLVHHRDTPRNGTAPGLLDGYGSYGATIDPDFRASWVSLLERGWVVAIAHPRGGGYLGRAWYEAAKFEKKARTFADFEAAAEALVAGGWVAPGRLAIQGGSAGGLLVGAVVNRRPELFRAAVAEVPFVDVLNTMSDPTIPLTVGEYLEWGNPADPAIHAAMSAYSPYDNVRPVRYPDLYVTAGLHDPRVAYWEAAKWVARLRATVDPQTSILLRMHLEAGHGGSSARYAAIRERAEILAWLLDRVGAGE